MKILYFSDEFPPTVTGGAAIAAYDIANAVFKKGHKVFVITANYRQSRLFSRRRELYWRD